MVAAGAGSKGKGKSVKAKAMAPLKKKKKKKGPLSPAKAISVKAKAKASLKKKKGSLTAAQKGWLKVNLNAAAVVLRGGASGAGCLTIESHFRGIKKAFARQFPKFAERCTNKALKAIHDTPTGHFPASTLALSSTQKAAYKAATQASAALSKGRREDSERRQAQLGEQFAENQGTLQEECQELVEQVRQIN
jgi:hypothetical protein